MFVAEFGKQKSDRKEASGTLSPSAEERKSGANHPKGVVKLKPRNSPKAEMSESKTTKQGFSYCIQSESQSKRLERADKGERRSLLLAAVCSQSIRCELSFLTKDTRLLSSRDPWMKGNWQLTEPTAVNVKTYDQMVNMRVFCLKKGDKRSAYARER